MVPFENEGRRHVKATLRKSRLTLFAMIKNHTPALDLNGGARRRCSIFMNAGRTYSRRQFLCGIAGIGAGLTLGGRLAWPADRSNSQVAELVAKTIGIDTHNHIDVPLTAHDMPGPDLDLKGEMKKSGLAAICMTFATDYQPGDPYDRFLKGLASMDRQLELNGMKRSLTPADVREAHRSGQPTVIQAVEGAHFLQGHLERVEEAYGRGLRHFGLLHDSDASVPLGDVYTNAPRFGGLTAFGTEVVKECNRLGILIDLAHADVQTTKAALKVTTRPVVISHTGLDTQLGSDPRMAQMMRPRLIGKQQARMVANAGGLVGVWTHLAATPLEYAQNIRALVDVIGVDHVSSGRIRSSRQRLGVQVSFDRVNSIRRLENALIRRGRIRPRGSITL